MSDHIGDDNKKVEPQPVTGDPHSYAVVSADYSSPFLLGVYPELENAVKAQCGSPEKWHIFERLYTTPSSAGTVSVEELVEGLRRNTRDWSNTDEVDAYHDALDDVLTTLAGR